MKKYALIFWFFLPTLSGAGVYDDVMASLKTGDTPAIIALLERGVDVDTVDADGNTLLMLAVRTHHAELLEQLLLRRARVNSRNRNGDSALRLAAFDGNLPFVQRLIQAGAEVNMSGWSPLAYAAFNGHTAVAEALLKRGADVDARTDNGSTALMFAARNGHRNVAELLLKAHADPDIANENGDTALGWAEKGHNTDIARLLQLAKGRGAAGQSQSGAE